MPRGLLGGIFSRSLPLVSSDICITAVGIDPSNPLGIHFVSLSESLDICTPAGKLSLQFSAR
jgi:hypothetical protein